MSGGIKTDLIKTDAIESVTGGVINVNSNINFAIPPTGAQSDLKITTVGTNGNYATVRDAITAGASRIFIANNTSEIGTGSIVLTNANQNISIIVGSNVIWDTSAISGAVIVMPATLVNPYCYIETQSNASIIYKPTTDFASFVNSVATGTASTYSNTATFERGNFNIDISTINPALTGISILRNIGTIKSTGRTEIKLGNNSACGIRYVGVNTNIQENAEIVFTGGGALCDGVIFYNTSLAYPNFNNTIFLKGIFNPTTNIIDINANIKNIYVDATTAINIRIGGKLESLSSKSFATNIIASANNTIIKNAILNGGDINVTSANLVVLDGVQCNNIVNPNNNKISLNNSNTTAFENNSSYTSFRYTILRTGFSATIPSSTTKTNLLTYFDTSVQIPVLVQDKEQTLTANFIFDNVNKILIFPTINGEFEYDIRLLISGSYSGSTGTPRYLSLDIQRQTDLSEILGTTHIKVNDGAGAVFSSDFVDFPTFTVSSTDPFSASGIKILAYQGNGVTLTLTALQLSIVGRKVVLNKN